MIQLTGDFGSMVYSGNQSGRYLDIPTEVAMKLFSKLAIQKPNIVLNALGMYTLAPVGRDGKARFANLSTPRHLLQKRNNGCAWNAKGRTIMETDSIDTHAVEYNGEQCPDHLWEGCLELLAGAGNDVKDVFATPESAAIMQQVIERTYLGLGNSFYDLINYGQHPLITQSDTNGWYNEQEDAWDDFVDQQSILGGHITQIDALKSSGYDNFQVVINEGDTDGNSKFTANATDLFDEVIARGGTKLRIMVKQMQATGGNDRPLLLVSPSIYNKYRDELINDYNTLPEAYTLQLTASDGRFTAPGVLMYDGFWVVRMDEWDLFDEITGTKTFRCLLTVPGNFAVAYDVPSLNQFTGMNMRIVQKLDPPYNGKVYMHTNFKVGAGIIDTELMTMAALTLTP